ncbi:hypothetical protein Clacol_009081 [Clathrus columnatus]|uniref:Uncharacterized protein n=1 Tax=Clathrus columnatus TaxID=1419009 RepID=A0AAV5AP31_9AGAM|nr:hypothetical protein Clacol_009081 [Clathrus columnatus]
MFWPCAWGTLLSTYQKQIEPSTLVRQLSIYFLGSVIVHSAGCTWNDIVDKDFDAKFERTKRRPLPSGAMSISTAVLFFISQYINGFNESALGLGMNWGIMVAWVNNVDKVDSVLLGIFWTMYYDTILLVQDRKYSFKPDVNPNAFLLNRITRFLLWVFCAGFILSLTLAGIWSSSQLVYYILTVGGTAAYLLWQFLTLKLEDPQSCFTCFDLNSKHLGLVVLSGMFVEYVIKTLY